MRRTRLIIEGVRLVNALSLAAAAEQDEARKARLLAAMRRAEHRQMRRQYWYLAQ